MNIISAGNVFKTYNKGVSEVKAARGISLQIPEGKISFLMGRSGSGKTTLINLLCGLEFPDSGAIAYKEKEITGMPESEKERIRRQDFGFVFQSVALFSNMTAIENVDASLRIAAFDKKSRNARALDCLDMVGMSHRTNHLAYELSGGEQQRVAIARAIAHRPAVIFADEPTAELDSETGKIIMNLFKELSHEEGMTFIISTHDTSVLKYADNVFYLEDGELIDEQQ